MPAYSSRGEQLAALARRLGAQEVPYYLSAARSAAEPAPGWYWRPAGARHPVYLAHAFMAAHYKLMQMLEARS